jgi:hypothetical protein
MTIEEVRGVERRGGQKMIERNDREIVVAALELATVLKKHNVEKMIHRTGPCVIQAKSKKEPSR